MRGAVGILSWSSRIDLKSRLLKSGRKSSLYSSDDLACFQLLRDDLEHPPIDLDRTEAAFELLEKNRHGYAAIRLPYA